ncbi:hypothetical protein [Edaphobacter aggregans]
MPTIVSYACRECAHRFRMRSNVYLLLSARLEYRRRN